MKSKSNALATITRYLIGRRQKFATVYSAETTSLVIDQRSLFYIADEANVRCQIECF